MDPFAGIQSFWDISQQPNTFSSLPDDDFLAFLEKQFPAAVGPGFDGAPEVIDPAHLSRFPSNSSPTSSESSPSPPSLPHEHSPERPGAQDDNDAGLKRKASSDSMNDEPTHKNPHTTHADAAAKKAASARRKSTGNPQQDESRLMKRKEQNRAAQRAFRERKEKHVKDLEDKVAALEEKNQVTESENENLRDLLARLQSENMVLKQAAFTFQVPREAPPFSAGPSPAQFSFASPGAGPSKPPQAAPFNFGSLIAFDPSMLNADNDPPEAMSVDAAYAPGYGQPPMPVPYKTIAANPMFMSFAEPSPYDSPPLSTAGSSTGGGAFGGMTSFDQWSPPDASGLDHLFGGNYLGAPNGVDFNALLGSPPSALSPVSHTGRTGASSPGSSPSVATPAAEHGDCPRSKEDLSKFIQDQGDSAFACEMPIAPFLRKASDGGAQMIMCKGSKFPPTEKSDKNVEVLTAWRSITSNPQFKDLDINELCTEFTKKARCDGTKVVLEPQGVHCIIESLAAKRQSMGKQ